MRWLAQISLHTYAGCVMLVFGAWQAALGAATAWARQEANPGQALVDAQGMSVPFFCIVMGLAVMLLALLVLCRLNWARVASIYLLLFYAAFLRPWNLPVPAQGSIARAVAVKIGASTLWFVPLMLVVLLLNHRVKEEFVKHRPPVESEQDQG